MALPRPCEIRIQQAVSSKRRAEKYSLRFQDVALKGPLAGPEKKDSFAGFFELKRQFCLFGLRAGLVLDGRYLKEHRIKLSETGP